MRPLHWGYEGKKTQIIKQSSIEKFNQLSMSIICIRSPICRELSSCDGPRGCFECAVPSWARLVVQTWTDLRSSGPGRQWSQWRSLELHRTGPRRPPCKHISRLFKCRHRRADVQGEGPSVEGPSQLFGIFTLLSVSLVNIDVMQWEQLPSDWLSSKKQEESSGTRLLHWSKAWEEVFAATIFPLESGSPVRNQYAATHLPVLVRDSACRWPSRRRGSQPVASAL